MLLLALLTTSAFAQDVTGGDMPALNAQAFRPSVDSFHFFRTTETEALRDRALFFRGVLGYAHRPLVYYPDGTDNPDSAVDLVGGLAHLDLAGGYTIGRFRGGLLVPLNLRGFGDSGGATGLGDLMVDLRLGLLDRDDAPLGVALSGRLGLPTATGDLALGTDGVMWEAEADVDVDLGSVIIAANLGQRGQPKVELEGLAWGSQLMANLGVATDYSTRHGGALELMSSYTWADLGNVGATPMEAILSGWFRPVDASPLVLRAGLGMGLTEAITTPAWRGLLTVSWEPIGAGDRDLDGITDDRDQCRDVPEDLDGVADSDGCPEGTAVVVRVVDQWGDAVPGATWSAGDMSGKAGDELSLDAGTYEFASSPEGYEAASIVAEISGTGSSTVEVVTPMILGSLVVLAQDAAGNAVEGAWWRVVDYESGPHAAGEAIQLKPGTRTVLAEAEGYRGVRKEVEVKRETTETITFELVPAKAVVQADRIDIQDKVFFETDQAVIKSESHGILDEVAEILVNHPELQHLTVEGHTDSVGDAGYNKDLSQRRADAVRTYLVERGVEASRITAIGYGEERLLVEEKTEADRAKNRRVQFYVDKRSD